MVKVTICPACQAEAIEVGKGAAGRLVFECPDCKFSLQSFDGVEKTAPPKKKTVKVEEPEPEAEEPEERDEQ